MSTGAAGALPASLAGGCQCGACRYEVAGPPLFGYVCHCLECRRQSSSAFATSIIVATEALTTTGPVATWVRDNENGPPLEASFCPQCGVRLFHPSGPREPIARLRVGTLDDASWFRPAAEFFTKRRLDWVDVGETIECVESPDDRGALLEAWQRMFPPAPGA